MAVEKIKKMSLSEQEVKAWEKQTAQAVKFNDVEFARKFVRSTWNEIQANKGLAKDRPDLYERLERLFYLNSILTIPALSEAKLVSLLNKGIGWYFKEMMENHVLWEKIKAYLVAIFLGDRDQTKERLRRALLRNEEILTQENIERNNETYRPTIKEWLVDYTSIVGNRPVDALRMNEYFASSKNFQKLPTDSRDKVRILIELYENLKRSSLAPEGLEETIDLVVDDNWIVFDHGRFENLGKFSEETPEVQTIPLTSPVAGKADQEFNLPATAVGAESPDVSNEVMAAYRGDTNQLKAIVKETEKLTSRFNSDTAKLRQEFFGAVQKKNVARAIAILRILAQLQDLEPFIKEDEKLNKFLTVTWAKQYGQNFAQGFVKNSAQPKYVRAFLRYVLEQRLEMTTSDAARVGLQIGNIFVSLGKKSYNKMAYFDVSKKEFSWFE